MNISLDCLGLHRLRLFWFGSEFALDFSVVNHFYRQGRNNSIIIYFPSFLYSFLMIMAHSLFNKCNFQK